MTIPNANQDRLADVIRVLDSQDFQEWAKRVDRRRQIQLANDLGGPRMRLLHWHRLAELERIPQSSEAHAVDAIEGIDAYGAPRVEVIMVSHRWLRPSLDRIRSHPDCPQDKKAKALHQFSLWRRKWVKENHGFLPEIFYWIDYSCIDQRRTIEAIPYLPIWVACCERFLRIETEDYDTRAWCRLEPMLSYVYSFADHQTSIGLDFQFRWPHTGQKSQASILNPCLGKTTDPNDLSLLTPIAELAARTPSANAIGQHLQLGKSAVCRYRL